MVYGEFTFPKPLWNISWYKSFWSMHKYIIRIMMSCKKKRESCWHLFRKLKILPLPSQYVLSLLLFVINNRNRFTINSEIYNINITQFNNFHQPTYNLSKYQVGPQRWHTELWQSGICKICWNSGIQFNMSSQSFNICVLNFIHQHSQFLGTVPEPGVWTVILLLLSCVGQPRTLRR
jgi:hypothetical protein